MPSTANIQETMSLKLWRILSNNRFAPWIWWHAFGGQAYAVLMPNTNTADAINACDRISNYIAHYRFDTSNNSFFVTVTGGIVDTEEFSLTELNSKQLLFLAEERVKEGKSQGGNRLITDHRSH